MTKSLMFQGTGSNVGKSVLVAGLCRAFTNRDMKVLPFKPQNMSNNAAVAQNGEAGGEIGRAQWLQALACRAIPSVHMNPILLKPQSNSGSQIIVQGKLWGSASAREYQSLREQFLEPICDSFNQLQKEADLVLVEGAGSPAEINLREGDIANMGFSLVEHVPVVMVGDIDRGGVIASLAGTNLVLSPRDKNQIKGFIINKFRGDASLFDMGRTQIVNLTGWADLGLVPWLDCVSRLPEEDSLWFETARNQSSGKIKVAVPVCGKIANFDDIDPLVAEPELSVSFVRTGSEIPADTDLIVLAGSKSTISDMRQMHENGWAEQIINLAKQGAHVIGICGGYQMLGNVICDNRGVEGEPSKISGLGLLDIRTELDQAKTVRISSAISNEYGCELSGYEIHLGRTFGDDCERSMISIDRRSDGANSQNGKIRGCYLHGIFANDEYRAHLIKSLGGAGSKISYANSIDTTLDELASHLENHLDLDAMLRIADTN